MTKQKQLDLAVEALRDILDPVAKLKRELKLDECLNMGVALQLADSSSHLRQLARTALQRMGYTVS